MHPLSLLPKPPKDVTIEVVITDHLLTVIGDMRTHGSIPER
jgi:hypothetical protein